ncbi:MAG: hypothetical protein ACKOTD_02135, partial [Phycisphaerales bacterium]
LRGLEVALDRELDGLARRDRAARPGIAVLGALHRRRGPLLGRAGETVEFTIESDFKPTKAVVDPDVRTLMLNRKLAEGDVTAVTPAT